MEQNHQQSISTPVQSQSEIKFIRNDAISSLVLGLIIGFFAPLILQNIGKTLPLQNYYFAIFPALTLIGVWVAYFIGASNWFIRGPILVQIVKFGVVGVANTVIDFGVLNYLSAAQHVFSGLALIPLNIISFTVAVINSYFWNKHWTFKTNGDGSGKQFAEFIIVSVIAIFLNSGLVYLFTLIPAFGGVSEQMWLNISKAAATLISLVWNFIGYKFVVFR